MATQNVEVNFQAQVGPSVPMADGVISEQFRAGKTGEVVTTGAHGANYEATSRGKVYCACNQSAITFGTALTATAVTFTLWNPLGSGYLLSILHTTVTVITTTVAGSIVYAANVNPTAAVPATNTELAVRNARLDGSAGIAKVYSVTTLPAAPVAIRTLAGSITAAGVNNITDYVDGAIVLGPNTAVTIQGITVAGTGLISMFWEEIPLAV